MRPLQKQEGRSHSFIASEAKSRLGEQSHFSQWKALGRLFARANPPLAQLWDFAPRNDSFVLAFFRVLIVVGSVVLVEIEEVSRNAIAEETAGGQKLENLGPEGVKPTAETISSQNHSALAEKEGPSDKEFPHSTEEEVFQVPAEAGPSDDKKVSTGDSKVPVSIDKEPTEPLSDSSAEKETHPTFTSEEKPIHRPICERPSLAPTTENHPLTLEDLYPPTETGKEVHLSEIDKKEQLSIDGLQKESPPGSEPALTEKGTSPSTTESEHLPKVSAQETVSEEAEYLVPVKRLEQVPAVVEEKTPLIVTEKDKPSTEEAVQTVEAEKLPEKAPAAEGLPPSVVEKEITSAVEEKEPLPTPTTKEPPSITVMEKHPPAILEEESSPVVVGEEHTLISPAKESVPAEPEYLAPTRDLGPVPTVSGKEITPTGTEEKKPSVEEPPKVVETEKLPEKTPAAEDIPPIVAEEERLPSVEEKAPSAATQEPPPITVAEKQPSGTVEGEPPPSTVDEGPAATVTQKEPPPVPAKEAVTVKEEDVEPSPGAPGVREEVTVPSEPPAETVEEPVPIWEIWHTDPAEHVLLAVAITLVAAKVGGEVARMLRLPPLVGKLTAGMLLGNICFLTGWDFFNFLRVMPFLKTMSYFGALILLLSAGLHTDLRAMLRVGTSSILIWLGGIIAPAGLGFVVGHFLLPDTPLSTKILLSIILCESSTVVLISMLSELKALNTQEGRITIGASILTDVSVLLAFGIISGIAVKDEIPLLGVSISIVIMFIFLAAVIVSTLLFGEKFGGFVTRKVPEGLKISIVALVCLLLAFLAGSLRLGAVIGAFAAGLFLRNVKLLDSDGKEYTVDWLLQPAYILIVPIFFVRAGAWVRWESLLDKEVIVLGLAITGAAILGKVFCSLCVIERGVSRLAVGLGMMPRLEIALITAGLGRDFGLLNDILLYSFIILVMVTSIISPLLFRLVFPTREKLVPESPPFPYIKEETRKVNVRLRRLGLR